MTPAGSALLVAEGLAVGRGSPLLHDVNLRLLAGECWFVLGRNGVGKTTLVATLLGLLPALGGTLQPSPTIADRSGIGYVPQEQRFDPPLPFTAAEFVELGVPGPRATRRARIRTALAAMQVDGLVGHQVRLLSVGQRRRVLVARALARRPQLLVLDEPTANLDAHGASALCSDLERQRAQEGLGMLHITHDLRLAQRFATHIALVADGSVHTGAAAHMFADARLHRALDAR